MFLNKRENGYYYIYFRSDLGKWISISTKTKSKIEANNFLVNFLSDQNKTPTIISNNKITYEEFIKQYLQYSRTNHSHTYTTRIIYCLKQFTPFIGGITLENIKPLTIENYKSLRLTQVSKITINIELRSIKAIFNKAVEWGFLQSSPLKGVKLFSITERKIKCLSDKEFQNILQLINQPWLKRLVIAAVNTGMRRNELLYLRWEDIDLDNKYLIIRNREDFSTKSKKDRLIPLNDTFINLLRSIDRKSNFVFTYEDGKRIKPNYVTQCFRDIIIISKINRDINFHSLRHTFATWLVTKGASIFSISKLLGHSSVAVTEIYSHLRAEDLLDTVNKLDK